MKSFKKFVTEVAQPKPEEEKRFKDQHTYEVIKHPVATDAQFTGDIDKPKAKRIADQEGDANYDKAVKNPERRMAAESVNEEAEQIDEISKDLAQRYYTKSYDAQRKAMNTMIDTEKARKPEKKKAYDDARKTFHKRGKGTDMAAKRLAYKGKNEEVEQIDEISKALASRYLKKVPASAADAGDKIGRSSANQAGASADVRKGYEKDRKKGIKTFLNRHRGTELAVAKLTGKAKQNATESTADDRARYDAADDKDKKKVTLPKAPWDKKDEELSAKQKKIDHNKNGKIDGHDLAMLRKKKNEEVELDETTSSALKRPVTQTGPDGKTRTVMKKARNDRTDDRGQDKLESVEMIDEAMKMKRGPMRLKDGSQIMVSKEDADLLNRMFKDLSANNQRQMQKVMMMDKAGYEEIRGFAKEAL